MYICIERVRAVTCLLVFQTVWLWEVYDIYTVHIILTAYPYWMNQLFVALFFQFFKGAHMFLMHVLSEIDTHGDGFSIA